MARFDRYFLSQLMVVFGFFSLVLVLVYWINRAVVLFDKLIADGQSAGVFLEFTALSLPAVIQNVLPIAAFAASVYVTNRMSGQSELVVVQATGFSSFRLARPVLYFGLIVTLLMSTLTHFLVPLSTGQLDDRKAEIAQNVTARLLTAGQFIEPSDGITFYVREITPAGELRDIFLSDTRNDDQEVTYTASTAYLVRAGDTAQLVMVEGLAQTLDTSDQRLFTTSFSDITFDIGGLLKVTPSTRLNMRELGTLDLLSPTPDIESRTRRSAGVLVAEGHDRIAQAILGCVAALIGFAALLIGGFSRFGVWRQIVFAIFLIILIKAVEAGALSVAKSGTHLWPATYLPSMIGLVIVWILLFFAARPALLRRRTASSPKVTP